MYRKISYSYTTIGVLLLASIALAGPAHTQTGTLAAVSSGPGGIGWQPLVASAGFTLSVAGEGRWVQLEFGPGETPAFQPVDASGYPLPDGAYTWELRVVRRVSSADPKAAANGRPPTSTASRPLAEVLGPTVQSGSFTVRGGTIITAGAEDEGSASSTAVPGNPVPAQVIADDLIVQGSECVGLVCASTEDFGFDTLRLKEDNTRIQFDDTSNTGSFPTNNWQIRANDNSNGGADYLAFVDQGAGGNSESGTIVFSVEAGARANSLYVDTDGRTGFGTSTPAVELHTLDGDTPTLRFGQDGSDGFPPYNWDVAGNEANFFVRDITGGSKLPLRIRPGTPTSAVDISGNGVGIGTPSPAADLDIDDLDGDGRSAIRLGDSSSSWEVRQNAPGQLIFSKIDSGGRELSVSERLDANGPTLTVSGSVKGTQFISTSTREVKTAFETLDPSEVLEKLAALPVSSWRYMWEEASARHVGPMAEDFQRLFGLGDGKSIGTVDADGVLMAAVQGLKQVVDEMRVAIAAKDTQIAELASDIADLRATSGAQAASSKR